MANTHQPGPTPEMKIPSGGNRNAMNKPVDSQGKRDWSFGLFSCFDVPGTCCYSFWCPCFLFSENKSRMAHLERSGTPHPSGGESVGMDCCFSGWIMQAAERKAVRQRYRIKDSGLNDCLVSGFCSPCGLTQISREISLEEQSFGERAA